MSEAGAGSKAPAHDAQVECLTSEILLLSLPLSFVTFACIAARSFPPSYFENGSFSELSCKQGSSILGQFIQMEVAFLFYI